jgi:acyl-CoA dehydrogenase
MSELALLEQTVDELLARGGSWEQLEELGLPLAGVRDELGGGGGGLAEAAAVVRAAAPHGLAAPLGETVLLAGWLLESAALPVPAGPLTAAALTDGRAQRVPWVRSAEAVVVVADGRVGVVPTAALQVTAGQNLAGEERDNIALRSAVPDAAPTTVDADALWVRGALLRAIGLAGVLDRVLEVTIAYVNERQQFGRPLARFQAIQQAIALLAGEVAAARAAVDLAVERPDPLRVGIAKVRAGEAAGTAAAIAHQAHGAIGYTEEHPLHLLTSRLWAWRDEYGSEEHWAARVGETVKGSGSLWELLTA